MSNLPERPGELRPGYVLKRAQQALRSAMDDVLRPLGLTPPQYAALTAVRADPGISSAALARSAFVTAQTMQAIVANLERAGLLARRSDPVHGRVLRSDLTTAGRTALTRADAAVAAVEAAMVRSLSAADVATLVRLLSRCAADLPGPP